MKTKNIFRMLLVAAALLMGANNVKAETYEYEKETFASLTSTSIIRVNCSNISENYWQLTFSTKNGQTPDFAEWGGGTDWGATWYYTRNNHSSYLINNSYFDLKCDQNTVNKLSNYGLKIEAQGLTVTSVTIVGGGDSSKTTPILSFGEGAQETYNITFGDSFTGPTATCNIDGLEVTYTSSETSVAEVDNNGVVNIKKAGTTVITAQTEESDDYNAASISYTLNIAMAYSVTINAGSNGSVSVDKSSTAAGQTVTITTTPNSGYELDKISVKDASNNTVTLSGEGNTRTFTMPASNVTVSAEFIKSYSAAEADKHSLTFETPDYCAATWNASTNTFTWGSGGWADHPEWTFMAAIGINGDLSNWTHLHLHVSDWNNASAQQLTVVFKKNDGSNPPSGPTKEFVVTPNASGNIDINLVGVNWGNCDITNIQDLTIYGCTRDNTSIDASVKVTDAYYVKTSKADASISFSNNVELTFGDTFTPPTVTTTPADATLTYTTSDANIVYIGEDGSIIPVGVEENEESSTVTITGTIAESTNYTAATATYTIKVNKPTREGAVWTGAAWLGNYGIDGVGTQPQIPTNSISSANVGDIIRFYGKLGPLSDTDWRVEIHGSPWDNQLDDVNSGNTPDNAGFVKGYFDMPITTTNINMFTSTNNLTLNGYNLTITAVELITASTPAKQDVTLAFSASTATATIGQSFSAPTLTATSNGQTVTSLNIVYSSSKTSVATVNSSTGAVTIVGTGTTIITASFSGDNNYNAAQSVNYILTVSDPELTDNDWIQVTNIDYGYRTYVTPQAIDFSRSVGVEGYYATGLNEAGTEVIFTQVLGVCDARVPLLLKKTSTTECKLLKSTATTTATTPEGNMLVAGGIIAEGDNIYVLTYHSGRVVFAETNIHSASVDSEHAYLNLNRRNARAQVSIRFVKGDDATGINDVEAETTGTKVIYDLRGQRVEHPTKGFYIVNGKKVLYK